MNADVVCRLAVKRRGDSGGRESSRAAQRRLRPAYRATVYRVWTPTRVIDLRIGDRSAAIDLLLCGRGEVRWLWITAFNPYSQPLSSRENEHRQRRLLALVRARHTHLYASWAIAPDDDWPAERGVLVLGAGVGEGLSLARRFGQYAVVVGRLGGAARLRWNPHPTAPAADAGA